MLDVQLGNARQYKHLTIVPLLSASDTTLPYRRAPEPHDQSQHDRGSGLEHGRWHHVSPEMTMNSHVSPSKVRRHARDVEADHVLRRVDADTRVLSESQGKVWDQIAQYSATIGAHTLAVDVIGCRTAAAAESS